MWGLGGTTLGSLLGDFGLSDGTTLDGLTTALGLGTETLDQLFSGLLASLG